MVLGSTKSLPCKLINKWMWKYQQKFGFNWDYFSKQIILKSTFVYLPPPAMISKKAYQARHWISTVSDRNEFWGVYRRRDEVMANGGDKNDVSIQL